MLDLGVIVLYLGVTVDSGDGDDGDAQGLCLQYVGGVGGLLPLRAEEVAEHVHHHDGCGAASREPVVRGQHAHLHTQPSPEVGVGLVGGGGGGGSGAVYGSGEVNASEGGEGEGVDG